MWWILLAISAHASNAAVFIIDKGLLRTKTLIGHPARYAALSGVLAGFAGVLLVMAPTLPSRWLAERSLTAGFLWVAGLWFFYRALQSEEASRIVPLSGSFVAFFTWVLAAGWLGEELGSLSALGVLALVSGGVLLSISWRGTQKLNIRAVWLSLASSAAFASYYVLMKWVYRETPFLTAFIYSRIGVGVVGFGLLVLLILSNHSRGRIKTNHAAKKISRYTMAAVAAIFASKILGAAALLLQNYAIMLGSVTVVNALQGLQFAIVLILATSVSWRWPHLFQEELSRTAWWQKIAGIMMVSLGIALVVVNS